MSTATWRRSRAQGICEILELFHARFGPGGALGGDEFILLLLDCEVNQLSLILSRLDDLQIEFQGKVLPVTFSVGWKAYEPGDQFDELIKEADRHLYEHKAGQKHRGRL